MHTCFFFFYLVLLFSWNWLFTFVSLRYTTLHNVNMHNIYRGIWEDYVTPFTVFINPSELAFLFTPNASSPTASQIAAVRSRQEKKSVSPLLLTQGWNYNVCCYFIWVCLFLERNVSTQTRCFIKQQKNEQCNMKSCCHCSLQDTRYLFHERTEWTFV